MRRLQLFEFEDFAWVPRAIRDGGTDLLDLGFAKLRFYDGVAPKVRALIEATGATRIVDTCSGGGGGTLMMRNLLRASGSDVEFVLTDRFPNEAGAARVHALGDAKTTYRAGSVDVFDVPAELVGLRMMSGALHHFPPDAVRAVIAAVVAQRQPLAFLDVAASPALRRLPMFLLPLAMAMNMLALFVGSLFLVPMVRPLRASRLLLTYVLPLIPSLVAWDGTVSALRAYAPEELLAAARSVPGADGYVWASGVEGAAIYLTGMPKV